MRNTKYASPEEIYNRIAKVYRKKIQDFDILDFVDWCAEIETEYIPQAETMVEYDNVKIEIRDGRALVPSSLFRLELVYTKDGKPTSSFLDHPTQYVTDGTYIRVYGKKAPVDFLYIDYVGIPLDPENGWPLILRGHEQACEVYCKMKMHEEDFSNGTFSPQIYTRWEEQFGNELTAATGASTIYRNRDRNDMNKVKRAAHNIAYNPTGNVNRH